MILPLRFTNFYVSLATGSQITGDQHGDYRTNENKVTGSDVSKTQNQQLSPDEHDDENDTRITLHNWLAGQRVLLLRNGNPTPTL